MNLGNEVCSERDVLALIANQIRSKLKNYWNKSYKKTLWAMLLMLITNFFIVCIGIFFYEFLEKNGFNCIQYMNDKWGWFGGFFYDLNNYFVEKIASMFRNICMATFSIILSAMVVNCVIKKIVSAIFKYLGYPLIYGIDIIKRLDILCERIDSSIDEELNPQGNIETTILGLSISKKRTKKFTKATTREIEQELIEIISDIDTSIKLNSRFIIVLDELDKISPDIEDHIHVENRMPEFAYDENGAFNSSSFKTKKQRTLHLLSQLKYFISNAKAKFVFIAGHELHDAYLADVSDREFSISSMFNGMINIESFLSCDSQTKDVTKMSEIYVCKQIMKKNDKDGDKDDKDIYNLKNYYKELKAFNDSNQNSDLSIKEKEQEKIIVFLKHFITYLTFMSNGAPKKITNHFEKYVVSFNDIGRRTKNHDEDSLMVKISDRKCNYYLEFGYTDQQHIGFLHYIAYPIFQNIISPVSDYGDKLLVSSSFLIAHIYKHHASGFSLQNLEYLPELIENNRTPELREFIYSLIGYLGQTHLTTITSGLYHYKFPMRLIEEISAFSKKSEEVAAIFNFSRGESKAVKQYYQSLLEYHKKEEKIPVMVEANLHDYLGDLHLINEEYTEAVLQFRVASEITRDTINQGKNVSSQDISTLIVQYIKSSLKLGVAQEKRSTVDLAYLLYNDLICSLIAHSEINIQNLRLEYKIDNGNNLKISNTWKKQRAFFYKSDYWKRVDEFETNMQPSIILDDERDVTKYWIYGEELRANFSDYLTPQKSALISKLSLFQDLRLAYLPILAKLFVIEKQHVGGITNDNIKMAEGEFKSLYLVANTEEYYLLCVDFFRKLGNILYYKNSNIGNDTNTLGILLNIWGYDLRTELFNHYCLTKKLPKKQTEQIIKVILGFNIENNFTTQNLESKFSEYISSTFNTLSPSDSNAIKNEFNKLFNKIKENDYENILDKAFNCCKKRSDKEFNVRACMACKYYSMSLRILMHKFKDESDNSHGTKALFFLNKIRNPENTKWIANDLNQIALTLDATGDVMLCCSGKKDEIRFDFVECLVKNNNKNLAEKLINLEKDKGNFSTLERSFIYYRTAADYFYLAANYVDYSQSIIKILTILSTYINNPENNWNNEDIGKLSTKKNLFEKFFIKISIRNIYSKRDFSDIKEIKLYNTLNDDEEKLINLYSLSLFPDIEELLLAYHEFVLKFDQKRDFFDKEHFKKLYHSRLLTNLRNDSLIYNRIISLHFKAKLNTLLLRHLLTINIFESKFKSKTRLENVAAKYIDFQNLEPERVSSVLEILGINDNTNNSENVTDIFVFLISDSIFCLQTICEALSSTQKTTLFTNSFCGGIYKSLWDWIHFYKENFQEDFQKKVKEILGTDTSNMLSHTYYRENAVKLFNKSIEMHTGRQAYQDFIDGFYMLDDDLQNNTCQFYLALERYKINSGNIAREIKSIEKAKFGLRDSSIYEIDNYLK